MNDRLPQSSFDCIALTLWIGFLVLAPNVFLWLLIVCFMGLLWLDHQLMKARLLAFDYYKLRGSVTGIVVVSLLVAALQW